MRRGIAPVLVYLALSCTDPPTFHLPLSTQFPVDDVRLGMTFDDLRHARSEIMIVPDSAMVVEELFWADTMEAAGTRAVARG